jgi:hypothetical protein
MTQPNITCPRRQGFKSSPAHHWSEFFLDIRHQFHTSIFLSNWILTNQQTSIWNFRGDAYFEYTSCYFKVVIFFIRNLFWVRLPYLFVGDRKWVILHIAKLFYWNMRFLEEFLRCLCCPFWRYGGNILVNYKLTKQYNQCTEIQIWNVLLAVLIALIIL